MWRIVRWVVFVAFAGAPALSSSVDTPEAAAESAALSWLALVDAGNYAQSWSTASSYFRGRITQEQWVSAVSGVRKPLGGLKSRRLLSATFEPSRPGAPVGEYVVIQYTSSFEQKAAATETVTPTKDADGQWRVSGYYITK